MKELLDFVVNAVKAEERRARESEDETKPVAPTLFFVTVLAGILVEPSRKKAERHRERERDWIKKLEDAEKELREKGVSVEVYDQNAGTYLNTAILASGAIGAQTQMFQPRVDQKLLDNVKHAKAKMLEHRSKAEQYEKYARAFALDKERKVRLSVEDIHYFGLEG
jgi:hypothetical protein